MRTRESRERSAEVFRRVLAQMAQHPAAFNPMTYAVWYEHPAGLNGHERAGDGLRGPRRSRPGPDARWPPHCQGSRPRELAPPSRAVREPQRRAKA